MVQHSVAEEENVEQLTWWWVGSTTSEVDESWCGCHGNVWLTRCSSSFKSPWVCASRSLYDRWPAESCWDDDVAAACGRSSALTALANDRRSSSTDSLSSATCSTDCDRIFSRAEWMRLAFASSAATSSSSAVDVWINSFLEISTPQTATHPPPKWPILCRVGH